MHRRPEAELLSLDTELERTLRNLRKVRVAEAVDMADQEGTDQHVPVEPTTERPQRQRIMEDFWRPVIRNEYSAVRQPPIQANNFELKPALITMVQQHQFTGHLSEDPNEHLGRFLSLANTMKLNGVNHDIIKLQLIPFSFKDFKDVASSWFESIPYGSVDSWEELVEAFMERFFPPSLTSERRREIIAFKQGEEENLYNAWERYKKLLKNHPNGHYLSCNELLLKGNHRCNLLWSI